VTAAAAGAFAASSDRGREKGDPGGQLLIAPAGRVTVATDALLATGERLRALETRLDIALRRVAAADACRDGVPVPDELMARIHRVRELAASAREGYARVAENYTEAERAVERLQRDVAGFLAATLGAQALAFLARLLVLSPGLVAAGALLGWAAIPDTGDGKLETIKRFLLGHPELITNPGFVRAVSLLSTSLDDVGAGLLGVPGWAAFLPRPPGSETAFGAMGVIALGQLLGMMRETPVEVERVPGPRADGAPTGVRERLDRIPEGAQIRIERYEADGMPPRFAVFIGPTENFTPFSGAGEPWDSTSNIHGVAGLSPGSLRAVEEAMRSAGIQAGDEVFVAGFSQGGLVARLVAASGDWNVVGVETHGAPAGRIPVADGTAGLEIRHSDDLVPALGGPPLDDSIVRVERRAFAEGAEIPGVQAAPAHQRSAYERTADAIDDARSAVVREQVAAVDAFLGDYLDRPGGHVTASTYHATRTGGAG